LAKPKDRRAARENGAVKAGKPPYLFIKSLGGFGKSLDGVEKSLDGFMKPHVYPA
jgi:hypothetical protein